MRRVRNLTNTAALCALAIVLGACTPALEPAKPSNLDEPQSQSESPAAPTPELSALLNPLEQGITAEWEVEFASQPLAVTVDDDKNQVAVLTERDGKQTIVGLARVGDSALVEKWIYQLPQGEVENLIARDGVVYFNTIGAVADGRPVDLYSLNIRDGSENFRWSELNPFNPDAPTIVGAYLRGLGVVKIDDERVTAAIIDDSGKVRASEEFIDSDYRDAGSYRDAGGEAVEGLAGVAADNLAGNFTAGSAKYSDADNGSENVARQTAQPASALPASALPASGSVSSNGSSDSGNDSGELIKESRIYEFRHDQLVLPESADLNKPRTVVFPMLKALPGDWCEVFAEGTLCVERANKKLVRYDRSAQVTEAIPFATDDPAMKYRFVGGIPDLQLDALVRALAPSAFVTEKTDGKASEQTDQPNNPTAKAKNASGSTDDVDDNLGAVADLELLPLVDAYLYGEKWIPRDIWKGLSNSASCTALLQQAPFCIDNGVLVNVHSGEKATKDSGLVLRGSGSASGKLFTYRNGVLRMLRADSGKNQESGKTARSDTGTAGKDPARINRVS